MSEQMSSREIEDVLSSIRRLVAEDFRPMARAESGEKLILTPALRVVGGAAAASSRAPAPEPRLDSVVAALGAAVQADDWESETGDPPPELAGLPEPRFRPARPTPAPRRPPADALVLDKPFAVPSDPVAPPAPEPPEQEAPAWAQQAAEAEAEPQPAPQPQPSVKSHDPLWAERAEAEVVAELADAGQTERLPPEAPQLEVHLDEDALRDLVRAILRDELAGDLGERITRNIRKLVHAEIARALAARDLT